MNTANNPSTKIQRLIIVSDAWHPQVNGVVTTLSTLVKHLEAKGLCVEVIQPNQYLNFPLPSYQEIRCAWWMKGLEKRILDFKPHALHIATEGSLGWLARHFAKKHQIPFTSSYHTRYPEYIQARWPIPTEFTYTILKRFHSAAERTFVPTPSIANDLQKAGFNHLVQMTRGVDGEIFNPHQKTELPFAKPIQLYVGRIAPEKNIEAFLESQHAGTKVVVGDGPQLEALKQAYPQAVFVGVKKGVELAQYYASADVFVFPSKTDTFGVVNIEAIACGTPVAAYPVTGPKDIITQGVNGYLDEDLNHAIEQALRIKQQNSEIHLSIAQYTWEQAAEQFLSQLVCIEQG